MIQVERVTKRYGTGKGAFTALRAVSLAIKTGERVAIIGKSGSGKSTLLHLMAGLDTPSQGSVTVDSRNIGTLGEGGLNQLRNRTFGFVFQQFFLQPHLTVKENVLLPLKIGRVGRRGREARTLEALARVGLSDKANNRATDLSGGEKQRACIARALVNEPSMIFCDEPTGNLDTENGAKIIQLLFDLNQQGITVIIVTHDRDIAQQCGRIVELKDGRIVSDRRVA
ncbi:ABC transporter ATP-binding protein [Candidatus Berkelbacteria bacterium]|nr:ABC transporter ATP-binding protein [Candidatus Berkelbacteria bacterium]